MLAIGCGIARKYLMIIVTALTGAMLFFYSFGFMIHVLGNFFDTLERIKSGQKLETAYYVFLGLMVVAAIAGMALQFKMYAQHKRSKKDEYYAKPLI